MTCTYCFNYIRDGFSGFKTSPYCPQNEFVKNQVLPRVGHLASVLVETAACLADGVLGVAMGCLATLSGGSFLRERAWQHLNISASTFPQIFSNGLHVLNPKANVIDSKMDMSPYVIIRDRWTRSISEHITSLSKESRFFKREVVSRLSCLLYFLSAAVHSVANGILGAFCVPAAICTFGQFEDVNNVAYVSLGILDLAPSAFVSLVKFVNPARQFDFEASN